jgi:P27 family predicted phage terminase small subunit
MPRGSGRRAKPTKLKKLAGNPGKRELNEKEPKPRCVEPEMPPNLGKLAAAEWKSIVAELQPLGMLSSVDGKALAAYCHAFEQWVAADKEVSARGIIVEEPILDKEGNEVGTKIKRNPADIASQSWLKVMKSYLIEFGMTPSSRTRLRIDKPQGNEDPEEAYIRRKMNEAAPNSRVN